MVQRSRAGALSAEEKKIVKKLLERSWRNQDIQAMLNVERLATINSARITEVKTNNSQAMSTDAEVDFFILKKKSFDHITGLNLYDDERLIRAREAMIFAVQVFNSPSMKFKTEVFAVLANIAWTYLLHEFYHQKGVNIIGSDGRSLLLSKMIEKRDCPLSKGVKNNLRAMKKIRDDVEHLLLGKIDAKWQALFQACCLNFEQVICELFGDRLSLSNELAFALQFTKTDFDQVTMLNQYEIPEGISALDARLVENMTAEQIDDLEYQFRVIFTMDAASKSKSHLQFVNPSSDEGKEIRKVLVNYKSSDVRYPHKPGIVQRKVNAASSVSFTMDKHTKAWKLYKARPFSGDANPNATNQEYCIYHAAHGDYTYSDGWVDYLIGQVNDPEEFRKIQNYRRT